MPNDPTMPQTLCADVGGTNTRVAIAKDGIVDVATVSKFRNADFQSLPHVLNTYLEQIASQPTRAAVAVAGPVRDGVGELTNLDWSFDEASLGRETGIARVGLLNDLQAQGYGLGRLGKNSVRNVVAGEGVPRPRQTQLVIGVGTGFNAAPCFHGDHGTLVVPSECGHLTLPQQNETTRSLAKHFEGTIGFASVEDALSGRGLEALYAWNGLMEDAASEGNRDSGQIMALAAENDPRGLAAVGLFVDLLGAACGNLALTHLPHGGIYLIGGMARAMVPYFDRFDFAEAFQAKGRFRELMQEFSIYVVDDDFAALSGCAAFIENRG